MTVGVDRLYPEARALLDDLEQAPLPDNPAFDLTRSRAAVSAAAPPPTTGGSLSPASDMLIGGVPCRVYPPADPGGTLVHAHGGGFVEGDLQTHDAVCREVAVASGWAVVAVGYRLAPEHPFPAAFEDVEAVIDAVSAGEVRAEGVVPAEPLALLGDSAGAMLMAGVTLRERRRRGSAPSRFALQVLVYPDCGRAAAPPPPPDIEHGYGLTPAAMDSYTAAFLPDPADRQQEEVAPLLTSSYSDLPPAVVITAELDPLRESAEEYARRLAGAGVPVVCTRYAGTVHGFWRRPDVLASARAAVDQVAGTLRRLPSEN